jgi:cytochrome c556
MIRKAGIVLGAVALLAACKAQEPSNQAKPSNNVVQSAEASPPLSKEQALAVMKERHEHMEAFGDATKKATNALKASPPDLAAIRESAATIAELAPKLQTWFPDGTGPDVGKTRAKAELWQKPEDFTLKAHDFEQAASDFKAAADSGDMARISASFEALGKTCKACHELYRAPKKD